MLLKRRSVGQCVGRRASERTESGELRKAEADQPASQLKEESEQADCLSVACSHRTANYQRGDQRAAATVLPAEAGEPDRRVVLVAGD